MDTPIAFLVFNRPELTARTFAAIRARRPRQLFVVADGPRASSSTDGARTEQVRRVVSGIDWDCDVRMDFSPVNLGCKRRITSGLDWVFSQAERAIILEDDCLPHPDFFPFCEALLERFAEDERVWVITGDNFQQGQRRGSASYYFSRLAHVWGWATWRRAWRHNDPELSFWPRWRQSPEWLAEFADDHERRYWEDVFDRTHAGAIDTWDYQWAATAWYRGGLTATPNVNLVENIGIGPDATHTKRVGWRGTSAARGLGELVHPADVERDAAADRFVFEKVLGGGATRGLGRHVAAAKRLAYRYCLAASRTWRAP